MKEEAIAAYDHLRTRQVYWQHTLQMKGEVLDYNPG